ncbi:TspO protein [Methylobacterium sp. Leaf399]|uniref:TspO/MBR family protein n=1 Tax=Methylobacterium sp. Leaf399 TaxID=1736364 RepID=UPI0006F68668|nr:TspO/MBR family protein [Methylobacterium sp. Leaf399]KQT18687.1 TspO protein [Methylobacterium sp. Leaf399]
MDLSDWNWAPIGVAAAVAVLCALAGGLLTTIGPWYKALRKPSWQPPEWVFGPVWTTIFILAAISGVMAWEADPRPGPRTALVVAYAINVVLNIAWSGLFFRMRRPDWAFVEVLVLWASVVSLIVVTASIATVPALLLLPYLAWVSVASYLNLTIVRLNGPFGRA